MKILEFFQGLGFPGYLLLGALLAIPLAPAAHFLLRTEDDLLIASIANIFFIVMAFLAALIVFWRNPGLLSGVVMWVPIFIVNTVAIILSFNLGGNGYVLSQNPAIQEWKVFFYSLFAYLIPLVIGYTLRHQRDRTGWFELKIDRIKQNGDIAGLIHALDNPNVVTRRDAARALSELNEPAALEPLINALNDEDPEVRIRAIKGLLALSDGRSLEPLLARLNDPDLLVAHASATALATIGDKTAVEPLIAVLRSRRPTVSLAAAKSLGQIGDPCAIEPLVEALGADESLRKAAAAALVHLGDPRGTAALGK
jgi:hypothetical protein